MTPQVRLARPGDEQLLATLHAATVAVAYAGIFPADSDPPTPTDLVLGYRGLLETADATVFVADRGRLDPGAGRAALAGAIVLVVDDAVPARVRIERFHVHPDAQGVGIGRRLYETVVAHALERGHDRINLWVLQDNERARAIYEGWGWTLVPGWTLPNDPPAIVDVLYECDLRDAPTR